MIRPFRTKIVNKKILGVLDFSKRPFGLGDAIYFQAILCSLKKKYSINKIDICVVNDPRFNSDWGRNRKAIKHQLELREKTIILNPHIGNVFHFSKYKDYNRFRINNLHKYIHFPNRRDQLHADWRPLIKHYQIYNRLPGLSVNRDLMKWANSIIMKYVYPSKLIVVQIRNSLSIKDPDEFAAKIKGKTGAALRNSNLPEWENFFYSLDKSKYKVICISEKDEVVTKWCDTNLVLFSKNLGADFLMDCALIQASYLSLFPPSGLAAFAKFTRNPSVVYNYPTIKYHSSKRKAIFELNHPTDLMPIFLFQDSKHKIVFEKDKFEVICYHFDKLIEELNSKGYDKEYKKNLEKLER